MKESTIDGLRKNERIGQLLESFMKAFPGISVYTSPAALQNLFQFQREDDFFIVLHDERYNHAAHTHPFFELVYMASGTAEELVDDETVLLEEGDLCIHKPGSRHQINRCGSRDCLVNILMDKNAFMGDYYAPLLRNARLNYFFSRFLTASSDQSPFLLFKRHSPLIDELMELIAQTYLENDPFTRIISNGLFLSLFGELIRSESSDSRSAEITDYIAANLTEVSLQAAAAHFGYHEKYFSTVLKRETGRSFQQLLTEIRLTRAASLLMCTELTIEQIAWEIGYQDVSSLHIRFPEIYGMTPSEYRRLNHY